MNMASGRNKSTFSISGTDRAKKKLPTISAKKGIASKLGYSPESVSDHEGVLLKQPENIHSFARAVHVAFASHYPLVLSPDMIWLCIMQGFSIHVNENAEKLRKMFVSHEGKVAIEVTRNHFVKGRQNPWEEVFSEFSEKICGHIGDETHSMIVPSFSTTGPVEKAASEIVLMEAMQNYFTYSFRTACGIPEFTLEGTVEDWKQLREKAAKLSKFDLEWWTSHLLPVLDQFVAASSGEVDEAFWSSIYKLGGGSGGPFVSGWILKLFPYLSGNGRNCFQVLTTDAFPSGLSLVPFTWFYVNLQFRMYFIGGFVGVKQDPESLAIRPEIGWAVVEQSKAEPGA